MARNLYEYTLTARRSVESARMEAVLRGSPEVLPAHLLIGVLDSGSEHALRALSALGVDPGDLRDALRWGSTSEPVPTQRPRRSRG
ncbi:MAG: Clp protease N-terminal domain-containing protein [Actinomycetota bacterium]|nr:Clp protease N-terminal domain-containing protein [Actinomycetota bacterium]